MTRVIGGSLIAFICLLYPIHSHSQVDVTTVGIQFKPIIEGDLIGQGAFTVSEIPLAVDIVPRNGFAFGMVIRRGITETISFEGGINMVTRKIQYNFRDSEIGLERPLKFGYVGYEIPIKGLVFIRLSDKLYMNNSLGPSLDIYASDVQSGTEELLQITRRSQWVKVALEANLGLEYRTRKSGYIYLGATYHNPFSPIARSSVRYRDSTSERYVSFDLTGGYLTVDLKYFFHERPERK